MDACYELHPGEDLHDGATFERFLAAVGDHKRANILYDPSHMVLQQTRLPGISRYLPRARARLPRKGCGIQSQWARQAFTAAIRTGSTGRAGSAPLGDGQIDFRQIFSKMAQYDYPGWAVVEWECCIKHPEQGAAEGAVFVRDHIIRVTDRAFDDFAGAGADTERNRKILGI